MRSIKSSLWKASGFITRQCCSLTRLCGLKTLMYLHTSWYLNIFSAWLWCCTDFVPFLLHDIDTRANSVRCKLSLFMQRITTSWLLLLTIHGASTISPLVYAWLRSSPPLSVFLCARSYVCLAHIHRSPFQFFSWFVSYVWRLIEDKLNAKIY
jgi:hypothetical protein